MCGVFGWWDDSVDADEGRRVAAAMTAALRHRGPDDSGVERVGPVTLGMTRLSVIDITGGHQPLPSEDGSCSIVFNGEIYNFRELREQLEKEGRRFRTRTDTEVVLHAWMRWGEACVHRLRGMFAFAVLDRRRRPGSEDALLFLARDRFGKKPLYYCAGPGRIVFASEIKALLEHPRVPRTARRTAIPDYLAYGYVPGPDTMFEGILELPPAHVMRFSRGAAETERYWRPGSDGRAVPGERPATAELVTRVSEAIDDAVRVRMVADIPLGAFLSGGLDSSLVVAAMTRHAARVTTFAIGFDGEPSFNELDHARAVARHLGTDHHELVVRPDAVELLPRLVWHHDQPFGDSSAIPTYLVSQLARDHVGVALTGDGGDELFAGYERFVAARLSAGLEAVPGAVRSIARRMLAGLPETTSYRGPVRRARRFLGDEDTDLLGRYLGWIRLFSPATTATLLGAAAAAGDTDRHYREAWREAPARGTLDRLLYVNAVTYLPGDLLVKVDRMSMACSLEARSPLLDHRLAELAAALPSDVKLRRMTTKWILRKIAGAQLPPATAHRQKHGFGVPVGTWLRSDLQAFAREMLLGEKATRRGIFDPAAVARLLDEHSEGRRDHGQRIWTLLTLEVWHRVFGLD